MEQHVGSTAATQQSHLSTFTPKFAHALPGTAGPAARLTSNAIRRRKRANMAAVTTFGYSNYGFRSREILYLIPDGQSPDAPGSS
jgi:hypothetical protein